MQSASVDFWDRCFWTSKKRGTHLYAARSQGERGSDASAIRDATGSDHRDANGVHHLRDKSHRLASVPWSNVMRFTSTTCSDFGGS